MTCAVGSEHVNMADTFFGFDPEIPAFEDKDLSELDPTLTNLGAADEYDQLNEDTFGTGALEDDWEHGHRKLAGLEGGTVSSKQKADFDEWLRDKGFGLQQQGDAKAKLKGTEKPASYNNDFEDQLDREEEILEQNLTKLVDDDEGEPRQSPSSSSKYKDIKPQPGLGPVWDGSSPLSSPTSSSSLHELISPSSSIWGSPSRLDKENTNKGPTNTQPSPLADILKAEAERKRMQRRPFSPAFEDDSIVRAMPRPGLVPPSQFMKKPPPVNAIRLEDLEKELTNDSAPQIVPEGPLQTPRKSFLGQPPPGIPRPMMTPPGFTPPRGRMHTPALPPQRFQHRPSPSKHPMPSMSGMPNMPGMPSPGPHFMRTPVPPFHGHPFPMMHSDPGHMMMQRGMLNYPMSPQHLRFASPQLHNRRFQDNRPPPPRYPYDNRYSNESRMSRQHEGGEQRHEFTDLERKIHTILNNVERRPRSDDPYAGLMTRREKEWLLKIQLLQLTSTQPELDDYYFQTYLRRKAAKERARQSEGVEHSSQDNRSGRETTKMALPQFERENKSYTPFDFQGSLGKVTSSSVQHPRQMVDLSHVTKGSEQDKQGGSTPMKDTKRRGQLLFAIEKSYDCLLNLESLEKKLIHAEEQERNDLFEARQLTVAKLFNLLKLSTEDPARCNDEFFVQFLSVRKGKVLLSRALPLLNKDQVEAVLMAITRNTSTLLRKDANEEALLHLMVPLNRVSELVSPSVVIQCLRNVVLETNLTTGQSSPLSIVLVNQFGVALLSVLLGRAAIISNSLTESDDDMRNSWVNVVSKVAKEFQDVPVKQLGRNLEAADRLVALLSTCTDLQTKALLQEHLRLAASTKAEITT